MSHAIQEFTEAINGAGLRCDYDNQGNCVVVSPCHGDCRLDPAENRLPPVQERAWSSSIYLDYASHGGSFIAR